MHVKREVRGRFWLSAVVASAMLLVAVTAMATIAQAGPKQERFDAILNPVPHDPTADNGSNVTGRVKLFLDADNNLRVQVRAENLDALPHAMHIHGKDAGELAFCPGADRRNDLVDDGLIETVEGLSDYGPIQVSFTTSGDTSPASGLALDRFEAADQNGKLKYQRTFTIPADIAAHLGEKHIVLHGEDLNNDGQYGGRITALGAPLEAELPVACGAIHSH